MGRWIADGFSYIRPVPLSTGHRWVEIIFYTVIDILSNDENVIQDRLVIEKRLECNNGLRNERKILRTSNRSVGNVCQDSISFLLLLVVHGSSRIWCCMATLRFTICVGASKIPHALTTKTLLSFRFSGCWAGQKRFLMASNLIVYQGDHLLVSGRPVCKLVQS